jgi:uncharacterized membrane protein YeiH
MFHLLDIIGTIAFLIVGGIDRHEQKMDGFGIFIVAL